MQSQGSTSSQPSFDSLSSSDSLLCSDSDQVEDDTDVFLTDGSSSGGATANGDGGPESPGSQWTCDGFTDKEEEEESYRLDGGGEAAGIGSDKVDPTRKSAKSQGDLLFAQKCAELQGFVRPMLELLNGLKKGRFERGLSTFQQSVAMDRIQRIVGVLQKPNSGEKYLNTLLQVEMMLKLWFPQITTQPASAASSVAASPAHSLQDTSRVTPPHKHKDQLHIPVKKRRLSWTSTDTSTPSPVLHKCPRIAREDKRVKRDQDKRDEQLPPPPPPPLPPTPPPSLASDADQNSPAEAGQSQPAEDTNGKDSDGEELGRLSNYKAGGSSEPSLTWVHVAPILSPGKACPSHEGSTSTTTTTTTTAAAAAGNHDDQPGSPILPVGPSVGPAMQDCAISSTTPAKHPANEKTPIPCQSQPVAEQQGESETPAAGQGPSRSPAATVKPLPRVCPAPVET